jgi:hypothetical protein
VLQIKDLQRSGMQVLLIKDLAQKTGVRKDYAAPPPPYVFAMYCKQRAYSDLWLIVMQIKHLAEGPELVELPLRRVAAAD